MFIIRKAEYHDLNSIARVQIEGNRSTYIGIMPDEYLNNLSYKEKSKMWGNRLFDDNCHEFMYVAECSNHGVVGFASASSIKTNDYYERELTAIYILKDFQGKGIGKRLTIAVVNEYMNQEINSMILWTLEKNPARKFYEHLGGRFVDSRTIDRGGKKLTQVAYGWEDICVIL